MITRVQCKIHFPISDKSDFKFMKQLYGFFGDYNLKLIIFREVNGQKLYIFTKTKE